MNIFTALTNMLRRPYAAKKPTLAQRDVARHDGVGKTEIIRASLAAEGIELLKLGMWWDSKWGWCFCDMQLDHPLLSGMCIITCNDLENAGIKRSGGYLSYLSADEAVANIQVIKCLLVRAHRANTRVEKQLAAYEKLTNASHHQGVHDDTAS